MSKKTEALKLALESAAGLALEVLKKHRQMKGEYPMGMLGVRAVEEIEAVFREMDEALAEQPAQQQEPTPKAIAECLAVLRPLVKGKWPHEQALEELAGYTSSLAHQQEPWGWAIMHSDGTMVHVRARVNDFFGAIQEREPFTAEDLRQADSEWAGLAPHSIVTLHTSSPASKPLTGEQQKDAARWRWLSEHITVAWDEGKFTSLVRIVSDKDRQALNADIDRMMAGDWSNTEAAHSIKE